jgi:hypothetical protein
MDLNYYYESKSHSKFFFGPRFRYGTDVNLANITAYTIQFQNGFLFCDSKGKMATTFAVGDVAGHGMSLERQDTAKPNVGQLYKRFADPDVLGVSMGVWQVHTPPSDVTLEVATYPGYTLPVGVPTSQPAPWGMPTAGTDVAGLGAPHRTPME